MHSKLFYSGVSLFLLLLLLSPQLMAASSEDPVVAIGDITRIEGMRENQLMGMGMVIGLAGTGDSSRSEITTRMAANMFNKFGISITPEQIESGNIAAVMVTATLSSFEHNGDKIDVTVNSIGDAESLQGGTLLRTPLQAANGEVYAVAQGPVSIGGFNVQSGGSSVQQNHPTVAWIPNGAIVEKELNIGLSHRQLTYLLNQPNFETASFIAQAINEGFKYLFPEEAIAEAIDPSQVLVRIPEAYQNKVVEFIAKINNLEVRTNMPAKVVINERTGTIVMGHKVRISTVSVAHGNLTITVSTQKEVSQPPSFSEGETEVISRTEVQVLEENGSMVVLPSEGTIQDLVTALNTIGASPRDIIAIIQQIKAAGALHAELELM